LAGYAALIPAISVYSPLSPGWYQRVNGLAAVGYVVLVYAVAMLVGTLATQAIAYRRGIAVGVALVLVLVVASRYASSIASQRQTWRAAFAEEMRIVRATSAAIPPNAHGKTVYVWGGNAMYAPGVPLFFTVYDLDAALKLTRGDPSLAAFPMYPLWGIPRTIVCDARGLYPSVQGVPEPHWWAYGPREAATYGNAIFLDVRRGTVTRIRNRATCMTESAGLLALYATA
jgi:hypothetical protein